MILSSQSAKEVLGLLVVGHGTRESAGLDEFRRLVGMLEAHLPQVPVEPCFLELAKPSIAEAAKRLVARGARHVRVLPTLLFTAGHAERDIPQQVAAALAGFADVSQDRKSVV